MRQEILYQLRVVWACARKDIRSALVERVFTIVGLFLPVNVLILMSLFVLAGSNAPTAVVMHDEGPLATALVEAMSHAHSFRLEHDTADAVQRLIESGRVVAVVSIPADFDQRLQSNQPVQVDVEINNLNTDFTNDIRRAIPLSITSFYATVFPHSVNVTIHETDFYPNDTDYIPYLTVSILVIALMIGGLLQSSTAAAREWENDTIKELLLSPASRLAVMAGKMLGAFVISLGSALVVVVVLVFVVGVWPAYWAEVIGFTLLTLVTFIALGTLLGTVLRQIQPVIALTFGLSIPLFFLSGAFGPISFSTPLLQTVAQLFPIYYQIVIFQHAFHNFALNTYGLAGNTLIVAGYAFVLIVLVTLVLRRSTVAH